MLVSDVEPLHVLVPDEALRMKLPPSTLAEIEPRPLGALSARAAAASAERSPMATRSTQYTTHAMSRCLACQRRRKLMRSPGSGQPHFRSCFDNGSERMRFPV